MHARLSGPRQAGTRHQRGPSVPVRGKPTVLQTITFPRPRVPVTCGYTVSGAAARGGVPPRFRPAVRVCQVNGVTSVSVVYFRPALRRPSKVMSNAFRAAFHRLVHRLRPRPVGSRLMIAM